MYNIDIFIKKVLYVVENHKVAPGQYARWIWQDGNESRELGVNEYGCADAANILYSLGKFPTGEERAAFVRTLTSMAKDDVYTSGKNNIFSQPEFKDIIPSIPQLIVLLRWSCLMRSRIIS